MLGTCRSPELVRCGLSRGKPLGKLVSCYRLCGASSLCSYLSSLTDSSPVYVPRRDPSVGECYLSFLLFATTKRVPSCAVCVAFTSIGRREALSQARHQEIIPRSGQRKTARLQRSAWGSRDRLGLVRIRDARIKSELKMKFSITCSQRTSSPSSGALRGVP